MAVRKRKSAFAPDLHQRTEAAVKGLAAVKSGPYAFRGYRAVRRKFTTEAEALGYSDAEIKRLWRDVEDIARLRQVAKNPTQKRNYTYPDIASIKRVLGAVNVTKIVNSHYPRLMIDALHKKFVEKQDWKKAEAVAALERYLNKATEKQARRRNGFGTNLAASMIAPIAMEAVEKASKNLQYGAKKVTTGKGKKNPVRTLNSKRIEELTPAQLKEQLSKSEKVVSALNQQLIDAGRGRDKFNDTVAKASTGDRLAAEYVAAAERQRDLFLERERRLRYSGTLKPIKTNPSVTDISEMFQGKASGKSEDLKAAWGAPANLSRAGKFAWLKIEGRRLPLRVPGAVVAIDTKGRLWLVGKHAPMFMTQARKGEGLDYGEIESIAYITAKAHIGDGKTFEYVHEFGEEGGRRPHLIIDDEGMPIIKGGDYTIRSEGIIN